ncbi:MAG: Holliday junction resolvase RuvX [Kiritimatiellae bacterium]|nr:Holliday junction resolvase RuvX [Kiritimatiellia bacterium]
MPRILGVDYGERRLGFALSDPGGTIATPLRVVASGGGEQGLEAVRRICGETGAERVVVGLPLSLDGTHGPASETTLAFVRALREVLDVPVETWDERLTTRAAERVLIEAGTSRAKRKRVIDKLAAQIMLQSYLDSRCSKELA